MSTHADVLVLGNGVLGNSIANAILDRDPKAKVAVVGLPSRPLSATMASGAMLGCFGEVTASLVSSAYGKKKVAMGVQAHGLWNGWLEKLNGRLPEASRVSIRKGTFVIENSISGVIDSENYEAIRATIKAHDGKYEDVDPNGIPGCDPTPDSRPLRAMYLDEGSIDSLRLLAALTERNQASGRVTYVEQEATKLEIANGQVKGLTLTDGTSLTGAQVVLAAGVGTQRVLDTVPELARRIPRLVSGMGCSLLLETTHEPTPHVVRSPNRAFACGLHAVPRGGKNLYVGATNMVFLEPWAKPPVLMDVYFLMKCAMEQIHQSLFSANLAITRTGNRPVSMDTCPLLGPTSVKGLWMMTGTYRDGLHLSPLLSQDLADRLFGGSGLFDHPFAPERKLISRSTKAQAIAEATKHNAAVGWEHGLALPKVGWHEMFGQVMEMQVRSIYDAIETDVTMPIDLFAMVDRDRARLIPYMNQYYAEHAKAWR